MADLQDKNSKKKPKLSLSKNLKDLMERSNISEHELSRRTNVKQPVIHRLLSGINQNPKLLTLKPIADYFALSVSQLIGEKEMQSVWCGFTSRNHHGWIEVPLLNHHQASPNKKITRSIITEANITSFAFAFYVADQSMEPLFPESCIVIAEPKIKPSNGDYILIKKSDGVFLRNFLLISDEKYTTTINNKFGRIAKISEEEEIMGTVVRTIYDHNHG